MFSCVITSMVSGNSGVLPAWSLCVCVWNIARIGLSVTVRIWSMICWP